MASKKTKGSQTTASPHYIILAGANPTTWVGSPTDTRTTKPQLAATWTDEAEAAAFAKTIRGTVQLQGITPVLAKPAAVSDEAAALIAGTPAKAKHAKAPKPKAEPGPKAAKGPSRQEVVDMLQVSGLRCTHKSSDHWHGEDPKGPRLVLPKADNVTRVYLYKLPAVSELPGYKTADQRKAEGLGAVTHVCDVTTILEVHRLLAAVCKANRLRVPKAPAFKVPKRTKATTATGSQEGLSGAESGGSVESMADGSDTSQTQEVAS